MTLSSPGMWQHARYNRRAVLEAGSVSLLGLGLNHLSALESAGAPTVPGLPSRAKSVIYIFLSGGLAQQDSFDPKPEAPESIRGEFQPIQTVVPGLSICEHLPRLAQRSHLWSVIRSLTHPYNGHSQGHMVMLSGRTPMPLTFNASKPMPQDWPSIPSVVGAVFPPRNNLPPAVVLPERLIHNSGRIIPGQFGGLMGSRRDPWFIEASPFDSRTYGAFPEYEFDHQERPDTPYGKRVFQAPNLTLPEHFGRDRLDRRLDLLRSLDGQRSTLDQSARSQEYDRYRQDAVALLTDPHVREAFDVTRADDALQQRYGKNSFGWSLLMARRLVEAGVRLVQVNLGNNETWDTHGNAFPHLKEKLLPPTDQALAALLDDLDDSGLLDSTLIVMAGEFGRTPRVFGLSQFYKYPGRDHWGAVQSVFLAGGGTRGGTVVGSSDKIGGYPATDAQTPENLAATIYHALGIPDTIAWRDELDRPHHVYYGEPIAKLF